ncbi:MAG: cyclic nucleotide-binding domain-containing protein [Labilithrix sp.]|nr:cyclic nucleotide-binding domain-containing protein [Labilithrix sp.]MCW5812540.1 cyclic nucleotide-binding domain-containing protein [Labilithrix sp.]
MITPHPLVYGKRLEDVDVLARARLLAGLGMRDVGTFLDLLDQVALAPGTTVFREGDAGEMMYFVLEGTGRIGRGGLDLRTIGPGDHFGELALLGEQPRATTVAADTTMRLARLSRSRYRSLALSHARVALHFTQALARVLGDDLAAMTDSAALLAHPRSSPRKLAVRVVRGGELLVVATGTLAGTLLPETDHAAPVVGATFNRLEIGLETPLVADGELAPLTLASPEGRAIHARSVALLVLEAARRVAPALAIRTSAVLEDACVLALPADVDHARVAAAIEAEAKRLIAEDVPLREEIWSLDEARAELPEREISRALLASRHAPAVAVGRCGETYALATGPLVPRASRLGPFTLAPHADGLLLHLPSHDAHLPARAIPRHGGEMAIASRRWLAGLGIDSVGAFDARCVAGGVPELIRVAEGFHEKWVARLAEQITRRRGTVRVVAVAGPSSSGKTTFIKRLVVQLLVEGMRPHALSLDDYFVDRERTVRDEDGELDFEAIEAIDGDLLRAHVRRVLAGEAVTTARYDFVAGTSAPAGGPTLRLAGDDVLLVEGIHGLHPDLFAGVAPPEAVHRIFIHPAQTTPLDRVNVVTPEDIRLLRRIVRDRHQRNYTAAATIARWPSVRRGDLVHVFPRLAGADAVFDSSLPYEASVLKVFAERYLLEVPPSDPAFTTAHRLRCLLDEYVAIHPDHVPPTSVIREFIGGSGFEY